MGSGKTNIKWKGLKYRNEIYLQAIWCLMYRCRKRGKEIQKYQERDRQRQTNKVNKESQQYKIQD